MKVGWLPIRIDDLMCAASTMIAIHGNIYGTYSRAPTNKVHIGGMGDPLKSALILAPNSRDDQGMMMVFKNGREMVSRNMAIVYYYILTLVIRGVKFLVSQKPCMHKRPESRVISMRYKTLFVQTLFLASSMQSAEAATIFVFNLPLGSSSSSPPRTMHNNISKI